MTSVKQTICKVGMVIFLGGCLMGANAVLVQAETEPPFLPRGVYIELTEDFYRALKDDQAGGDRIYGNTKSDEYLRRIAVSTRFMVETNLRIIKQQEKMIELLENMAEGRQKK